MDNTRFFMVNKSPEAAFCRGAGARQKGGRVLNVDALLLESQIVVLCGRTPEKTLRSLTV